jgi:hypothetical protein
MQSKIIDFAKIYGLTAITDEPLRVARIMKCDVTIHHVRTYKSFIKLFISKRLKAQRRYYDDDEDDDDDYGGGAGGGSTSTDFRFYAAV